MEGPNITIAPAKIGPAPRTSDHLEVWARLPRPLRGVAIVGVSMLATTAATLLGLVLGLWLPPQSVSLVYLLAVMLTALAFGTATGLAVAFLAFLSYNFFFIAPIYTFTITDPQEVFALIAFLAVAISTCSAIGSMSPR